MDVLCDTITNGGVTTINRLYLVSLHLLLGASFSNEALLYYLWTKSDLGGQRGPLRVALFVRKPLNGILT